MILSKHCSCLCWPIRSERTCFDLFWLSYVTLGLMSISPSPLLVISPFKATSGCVAEPAKISCPLFWLSFSWKEKAVWTLKMAVVGWVCCYPSLAFPDSSPYCVPSPMCGKKEVTELDWKWFPEDFKDTLLCLRSAWGGCSHMSSHLVKTHRFGPLVVLVKTGVLWICLAGIQTFWSST